MLLDKIHILVQYFYSSIILPSFLLGYNFIFLGIKYNRFNFMKAHKCF